MINNVVETIDELIEENEKLKEDKELITKISDDLDIKCEQYRELLKECKPYVALYTENNKHIGFTPETANLLQRIDEVLK